MPWRVSENRGENLWGKLNEFIKFTIFSSIRVHLLLRQFSISRNTISRFRSTNVSSNLSLISLIHDLFNLIWSLLLQIYNLFLLIWIGNSEDSQHGYGFGGRVLMSLKEKPAGSNFTFDCAPSGPCVPCIYSEKVLSFFMFLRIVGRVVHK